MTQSDQRNSLPYGSGVVVQAIRERTPGEKHAYLDGYTAGLMAAATAMGSKLEMVEQLREHLPPRP